MLLKLPIQNAGKGNKMHGQPLPTTAESTQPSYPPPKIIAAMNFLSFCEGVKRPFSGPFGGSGEGRELSAYENEVYESALTVLLVYFENAEVSSDSSPHSRPDDPGQDPSKPEFVRK